VHDAQLRDGPRVAVKVQYPGVRRSIDSDVDNMATLLRLTRALPEELDLMPLLTEAKRQLHEEADYLLEAAHIFRYAERLGDDPRFELPLPLNERSTAEVLCMQFLDGQPIEAVEQLPTPERTRLAATLLELALREVFRWGLVQSDPNFANYRYNPATGQLQLLDFGATRIYPPARRDAMRNLLLATVEGGDDDVARAAIQVGYLAEDDPQRYRQAFVELLRIAAEPARRDASFTFAGSDLPQRMRDALVQLRLRDNFTRLPPMDVLYLHRKISGQYLLMARLNATLPMRTIVREVLEAR
ncbi:MAG: AarF/ABC1/UbiB kinase family protein, partial [Acidihalobacter sp.]